MKINDILPDNIFSIPIPIKKFEPESLDTCLKVSSLKYFKTSCPMYDGKETSLNHCMICNYCDSKDFFKFWGIICKYKKGDLK